MTTEKPDFAGFDHFLVHMDGSAASRHLLHLVDESRAAVGNKAPITVLYSGIRGLSWIKLVAAQYGAEVVVTEEPLQWATNHNLGIALLARPYVADSKRKTFVAKNKSKRRGYLDQWCPYSKMVSARQLRATRFEDTIYHPEVTAASLPPEDRQAINKLSLKDAPLLLRLLDHRGGDYYINILRAEVVDWLKAGRETPLPIRPLDWTYLRKRWAQPL